jgi:hypothetical protein
MGKRIKVKGERIKAGRVSKVRKAEAEKLRS